MLKRVAASYHMCVCVYGKWTGFFVHSIRNEKKQGERRESQTIKVIAAAAVAVSS